MTPRIRSLAGLLLPVLLTSLPAQAADSTYQRVDFQTEVDREIPNDLLLATLSIELNNKSPATLARDLTTAVNAALAQARPYTAVKISSGNQQSWPVYNDKNKLDGWRGRAELRVESRDFKAAGELISLLQDKLQLNNLNFVVAPETRRQQENQLTTEAIAAFRTRAESISGAWNAKSYKLVQMNLGMGNPPPQPMMMMMRAAKMENDSAPAADYAGGQTRLVVQVSGTIELQP